jgi:hypothetical protein
MLVPQSYESPWMTDDVKPVADLARTFFANEVVPHIERFAENHQVDRELWNKAGDAGLLCITIPEEFGGGGGDFALPRKYCLPKPQPPQEEEDDGRVKFVDNTQDDLI